MLVTIPVTFGLGVLSWHFIELPDINKGKQLVMKLKGEPNQYIKPDLQVGNTDVKAQENVSSHPDKQRVLKTA